MGKAFLGIYRYVILIFSVPIIILLGYVSLISTTYVTYSEEVYFLGDTVWKNLLFLVLKAKGYDEVITQDNYAFAEYLENNFPEG